MDLKLGRVLYLAGIMYMLCMVRRYVIKLKAKQKSMFSSWFAQFIRATSELSSICTIIPELFAFSAVYNKGARSIIGAQHVVFNQR